MGIFDIEIAGNVAGSRSVQKMPSHDGAVLKQIARNGSSVGVGYGAPYLSSGVHSLQALVT